MQRKFTYALFLLLVIGLQGCGDGEKPFNQWKCGTGVEERGLLAFEMEGEEENLQPWVDAMKARFGVPKLTYLHFVLETYDAFFDPEHRAIDPDYIVSPYGIQKIMVWPGFCLPEWSRDTLQMSVQVKEHRTGKRPVDPYACRVELRLRNLQGQDLLASCSRNSKVRQDLQAMVEKHLGAPHDTTPDPELPARIEDYERRKAAYSLRVQDFLDPDCYPAILHSPWSPSFRLQVCEYDGMEDTLWAGVRALSAAGDELPYVLVDYINDTIVEEVHILDGIVGYDLYFQDPREVEEIWFNFRDGRKMKYYEKGDYTKFPLPYKPRYSPEFIRKRRERRLHEQLRQQVKVNT